MLGIWIEKDFLYQGRCEHVQHIGPRIKSEDEDDKEFQIMKVEIQSIEELQSQDIQGKGFKEQ